MKANYKKQIRKQSLISTGNNYRMKRVIRKAQQGEDTSIVYLGGSITMRKKELGDRGYADATFKFFKDKFVSGGKLNYVNSGMNGTSSMIGLIRLERDVLQYKPDIVFVEFSVNDSKDSTYREIFESMIVGLLESDSKPALVLIFLQSEGGYSCQGHMQVIGEHYQLPMISVCDAMQAAIELGIMKWSDYSDDNIHPHARGNDLLADFIVHYYETLVEESEDDEEILPREAFYGKSFMSMRIQDASNFIPLSTGGFKRADTILEFPNGWVRDIQTENSPFRFKLNFKDLFIVYKESGKSSEGRITLSVDGENESTFSGYRTFGWNNPTARLVYSGEINKEHLVEISMAKGEERKEFSLLAFGYCL